jgi:hypothetical protein
MENCRARHHRGCGNLFHLVSQCLVRIVVVYVSVSISYGMVKLRYEGDLARSFF